MTWKRGGARDGRDAPATAPGSEHRQTLLLPMVLERIDEARPLTVLDVGGGNAETIEFFSRYRCRLHFADLFDTAELGGVPEDEDPVAYFTGVFRALLDFQADTRFDVCLLWDFLNYLPVPALTGFSRALRPFLRADTVGHGFGAFKATAPGSSWTAPEQGFAYGVVDQETLVVRPRPGASRAPTHPHSRKVVAEALECFEIARGTLLQDGAMELLLEAR
jgi:hypothetical protein